jgi:hypothetical protein
LSGTQVSSSDVSEEEQDEDDQDPMEGTTQKGTEISKKDKVQVANKAAKKVGFLFFLRPKECLCSTAV